ncbi:MAG: ORF6N domain-containing protein [Gammaproteobacteria bacterium]|nr:ORF6N domain-containing protein [Gammaproteobacteria bacterium]
MHVISQSNVQEKIIHIRNQRVIIDADVAKLYGVETKRINEAVKNNPDKFPKGYLFNLTKDEWDSLKSKNPTSIKGGKVKLPTAFTEKGLYMLATVLKSPKAVETTLMIIDTFAKVRELSCAVTQIQALPENSPKQKTLMEYTGDLIGELMIPEKGLDVTGTETTYEINFAILKIKRTVKKASR